MLFSSLKCSLMYMHNPGDENRLYHVVSSLKCFLMYMHNPGAVTWLYHVVFVSQVFLNVYEQSRSCYLVVPCCLRLSSVS